MAMNFDPQAEWLEADGLGGFSSGTVGGIRTRRYHALLLTATTPPTGRMTLVNGFDVSVETPKGTFRLTPQRFAPNFTSETPGCALESFTNEPWPTWTFALDGGVRIRQELFVPHGQSAIAMSWGLAAPSKGVRLSVRPFLSARDYHSMHHENGGFNFQPEQSNGRLIWRPYNGVPAIICETNGAYAHEPFWYRNFLYDEEQRRGLDCVEDLAAPGALQFDLTKSDGVCLFSAGLDGVPTGAVNADRKLTTWRNAERKRREEFPSSLHRAADAYFVKRGAGSTIVAGYPWFTDWGRDTFIALRGLCLAGARMNEAKGILLEWAGAVSEGMLPNRFADHGESPEYNSVDASLWYVIAVDEFLQGAGSSARVSTSERKRLRDAVQTILTGYADGTRYNIRADSDGLLAAGQPGVQLTWMDAKVGDWVVTPRIGKPVEIQALWLNALRTAFDLSPRWTGLYDQGRKAFADRFWNESTGCLYDVIDVDHVHGRCDGSIRPNQIFAVGGLPAAILDGQRAQRVVDVVEQQLLTPLGLRSLSPNDPAYRPRYAGGVVDRDGAYHQGTVWPWLIGPFVEAWLRVRGNSQNARDEATQRFVTPLMEHLNHAGVGHVSEVADGAAPHTPGGCPFQAWSLGELIRLREQVLTPTETPTKARRPVASTRG